jgi:hypothetical protein
MEGHLDVVKAVLEAWGRELVMLTADHGFSCFMVSAGRGHLEVVKELLEVGGRELLMLTTDNGVSCLYASAQNGHPDVVKALLKAGGRELVMLTVDCGISCLYISVARGHLQVVKTLLEAGECELVMLTENDGVRIRPPNPTRRQRPTIPRPPRRDATTHVTTRLEGLSLQLLLYSIQNLQTAKFGIFLIFFLTRASISPPFQSFSIELAPSPTRSYLAYKASFNKSFDIDPFPLSPRLHQQDDPISHTKRDHISRPTAASS